MPLWVLALPVLVSGLVHVDLISGLQDYSLPDLTVEMNLAASCNGLGSLPHTSYVFKLACIFAHSNKGDYFVVSQVSMPIASSISVMKL